jgi:molecular chaperone GrpE
MNDDIEMKEQSKEEEYLAGWKRAQADYANLLKDVERQRKEYAAYATEDILHKLLPAFDQFEVALQYTPTLDAIPEDKRRPFETWLTGLQAVKALWESVATELGLELVPATGLLDPRVHEAVTSEVHEAVPAGEIIRVVQNGWSLKGKLLRPAKVIVSTGFSSS